MKRLIVCVSIIVFSLMASAQDPISFIIQQGIKKAIIAMDLKIQRLQTKIIWLQNAQKVVENTMSKLKLDEITGWLQKQKDLYQNYFDEMRKVKDVVFYYHRVKEITENQIAMIKQYHKAWNGVRQDKHFSMGEVRYIGQVYTGIIEQSLKNLEQVGLVINSFETQMTDSKRMEFINRVADAVQQNYTDLKQFNLQNIQLSMGRSKDLHDIDVIKKLYGIQ